jgi:uncharacterized protein YggE
MRVRSILPQVLVATLALAPTAAVAQAALKDAVPHITVVGRARTEVVPDIAILSVAVVTERPKAEDAAAENAQAAQALIEAIKAQGIDARDVQTVSSTLTPDYGDVDDASQTAKRTLRGYIAKNSLAIRVRALDRAGALARKLIDSGANQLEGIDFSCDHQDEAYDKLRDDAMRDALRRAKDYLPAVGVSLGRVLEINPLDSDIAPRGNMAMFAASARASDAAIPIEPGTLVLETTVQVTWEVTPK